MCIVWLSLRWSVWLSLRWSVWFGSVCFVVVVIVGGLTSTRGGGYPELQRLCAADAMWYVQDGEAHGICFCRPCAIILLKKNNDVTRCMMVQVAGG